MAAALTAAALALASLSACSNDSIGAEAGNATPNQADATDNGEGKGDKEAESAKSWPRTITHELGTTTLKEKPTRIANTALSATGTLLAMDAPLIASAATDPSDITDDKGFFSQWSQVADERGVEVLYPNLEFDLEALIAANPDVVVVSTAGADSVSDQYEQISKYFPTIAIDYSKQSWQDLARQLGDALGLEEEAEKAIQSFDTDVAAAKDKIKAPENGLAIISYNGPGSEQGVAKKTSAHAQLVESVGIKVNEAPKELDVSDKPRQDFAFVSRENLPKAIAGDSVLLISSDDKNVQAFRSDPVLANVAAVTNSSVYALGLNSFRIDPYSGREALKVLTAAYAK